MTPNRADIYSLATVLYEMLAGEPPHLGATAQQIILKIIAEPVPLLTSRRKSVPPNVSAAIAQALEKLPADRFESSKAFVGALENPAFRRGTAAEVGAPEIERWKRLSIGLAAAGVLLAGAVIRLLCGRGPLTRTQPKSASLSRWARTPECTWEGAWMRRLADPPPLRWRSRRMAIFWSMRVGRRRRAAR